jgi:hypothetical protein
MVVVGAHGWGSVGRVLHGSVSTAVVHEARCPVLVVPSAQLADQRVESLDETVRVREPVS